MKKFLIGLLLVPLMAVLLLGRTNTSAYGKPDQVANRLLVKLEAGVSQSQASQLHRANNARVVDRIPGIEVEVVEVKGNLGQTMASYAKDGRVRFVEPDYIAEALTSDSYFLRQWGLDNGNDADVDAPEAWKVTVGNEAIKVAILDSGIDQDHQDLSEKIKANVNFTDSGTIDDIYGHGTHVGGIVAASTNNNLGVAGVGYNTSLMNVKVLNDSGSGAYSWIASGMIWATDNGAKVINMSLGGSTKSSTLESAVNYAWNRGVVLVAAAGNSANPSRTYPAAYRNVISVAATDSNDQMASFSSYGSWVDVAAPGANIFSTFPNHPFVLGDKYGRSQNYDYANGTSMATPFVAGITALVWDISPDGTSNTAVRNKIQESSEAIPGTGSYWIWGRVNACQAVGGTCSGSVEPTPTPEPEPTTEPTPAPTPDPGDAIYCFKGVADGQCHPVKDSPLCSDCQR